MRPTTLAKPLVLVSGLFGLVAAGSAFAETKVTTYVVKVQEERENTRWTLTEWLRIKERMKMMDLWLAMFSDPKKDRFQPELMLSYGMTRGKYEYTTEGGQVEGGTLPGTSGRAQLWLTNLVSSTVGLRMLNIDLGGEAYRRQSGDFSSTTVAGATAATTATVPLEGTRQLTNEYYTGNLRIFGRNIQDSSLVLKYGKYTSANTILDSIAESEAKTTKGTVAGAELQLYLFRWLGAEGNYLAYGDASSAKGSETLSGSYYDYLGYVEISLLRIYGGVYQEQWKVTRQDQTIETTETGTIGGVKLQF